MKSPNIILITTDQQRFDGLEINGNDILQTPMLDSLAKDGVNFKRAYSTCPVCVPARRTLLTGLHPTSHGLVGYEDGLEFEPEFTLPGILRDNGYQTQLIGKFHMFPQRKRFGFDDIILSETPWPKPNSKVHGENDYLAWLESKGVKSHPCQHGMGSNSRIGRPSHLEEAYHHSNWLVEETVNFFDKKKDPSCPFFLHLSFWAPHPPFVPPAYYFDKYKNCEAKSNIGSWAATTDKAEDGLPVAASVGPFKENEKEGMFAGYYGLINHIDDCIQYLVTELNQTKFDDEPYWILFTTDHGEMLGDHHLFRKSLPYEGSAHIPFFVSGKGVKIEPGASECLVSLEDVPPTILELAGLQVEPKMDGKSLAPLIMSGKAIKEKPIYGECTGKAANQYIVSGSFKYIWFAPTNEEQLFNLKDDPYELEDLSGDESALEGFRKLMKEHLKERQDYDYDMKELKPLKNGRPQVFWP